MHDELYFTQSLTENEHWIVEEMIREMCKKNGWEVVYYRKFKNGHIPCERECKIKGGKARLIKQALIDLDLNIDNVNKKVHWTNPYDGKVEKIAKWEHDFYKTTKTFS